MTTTTKKETPAPPAIVQQAKENAQIVSLKAQVAELSATLEKEREERKVEQEKAKEPVKELTERIEKEREERKVDVDAHKERHAVLTKEHEDVKAKHADISKSTTAAEAQVKDLTKKNTAMLKALQEIESAAKWVAEEGHDGDAVASLTAVLEAVRRA